MIKLTEKYYLDFDTYNILVKEKRIGESGKCKGKEVYTSVAYCTAFDELANYLIKKQFLNDNDEKISSFRELQDLWYALRDEMAENLNRAFKDTEMYKKCKWRDINENNKK